MLNKSKHSYRGISWESDTDLSKKLGKGYSYVAYHTKKGMTHDEIIDKVLDGDTNQNGHTYRAITWKNDADLCRVLNKGHNFVHHYIKNGMTHEEIIDMVLDGEPEALEIKNTKSNIKVVARFEKVSFEEFKQSYIDAGLGNDDSEIQVAYDTIKLPERSTKRSSGYDFVYTGFRPIELKRKKSYLIPTGIRCVFLQDGYDLSVYPRSSMGFKYRVHLDNTVGIIDNDYFEADNEGHIKIKLSCDPRDEKKVIINPGDKFAQGILRQFFLAENDSDTEKEDRHGGMGSTGK